MLLSMSRIFYRYANFAYWSSSLVENWSRKETGEKVKGFSFKVMGTRELDPVIPGIERQKFKK